MTKKKNIDNLLVDLQKLLERYNASIQGYKGEVGIRIKNDDGIYTESIVLSDITPSEVIKNLD